MNPSDEMFDYSGEEKSSTFDRSTIYDAFGHETKSGFYTDEDEDDESDFYGEDDVDDWDD